MCANSVLKLMLYAALSLSLSCVVNDQNKNLPGATKESLYDGSSLKGWSGMKGVWSIEDAAITGQNPKDAPLKQNTFLVWDKQLPENYTITFKYRFKTPKGNSGLQYHSALLDKEKFVIGGLQADFETGNTYSGILYEERGRGIMAQRGTTVTVDKDGKKNVTGKIEVPAGVDKSKANDGWQDYKLVFYKNRAIHIINGYATVDVKLESFHNKSHGRTLGLQVHAGPHMVIQFKDMELTNLDKISPETAKELFLKLSQETKNIAKY
ncbi:MAG: DUF1080 domain-containing protein [Lentisphaeraceae bacterium]|nr:DUF1080 domain-containing protein [Lentisphaeraceae bacterium]